MNRLLAAIAAAALVVGVAHFNTRPAAADVYDAPTSIVSDCTSDATAALQAWINTVPDGATARLALGGCYKTEGPLLIKDRAGVTLDGNDATLQAFTDGAAAPVPDPYFAHLWPRKRTRVTVLGGTGVTVTNIVLRGGNPNAGTGTAAYVEALEAQHAVEFVNTSHGAFTNSEAYDMYGDFAYVQDSTTVTVSGNYFRRNGRQGMTVTAGSDIWFTGNDQADVRRSHFDIEANIDSAVIDGIHIEGNTTGASRLLWLANGGQSWHVHNIYVRGNTMTGLSGVPVITAWNSETDGNRGPYYIENNSFKVNGSPEAGFSFDRATGVYFKGNTATFPANRAMVAVDLKNVPYAEVANNTFTGQAVDVRQRIVG